MRFAVLIWAVLCFASAGKAQTGTYSATGDWVYVKIKPTPPPAVIRSFEEDFTDNRNRWRIGQRGAYSYDISQKGYRVRKMAGADPQTPAFSYIPLPPAIQLNKVDTFSVQVDITGPGGQIPDAGLLLGVRDSLNYCHFRINNKHQVSIKYVINGLSYTIYMRGDYVPAGGRLSTTKNTLTVRKTGEQIHFYLNNREVPTSPYQFRQYQGNGIGFVANTDGTVFRNLTVGIGSE
ncbi:hypothetical protein [Larkinella soli]|uniref:hypothetical protein n=1 Tax=Larkinella soli TaxID=1770527 RepID=UPI000FFB34F8|nr:hypothetical protein [Larkinella soli]